MSNKTLTFFKFDDFYLDTGERCLTFQNQPVALSPKASQTLVVLLRNHGRVVEKEYFTERNLTLYSTELESSYTEFL